MTEPQRYWEKISEQADAIERLTAENERLRAAIMEAKSVAEMDGLTQWVDHFDKALSGCQQYGDIK